MWRAFFMAVGLMLCILGLECMVIERAVLAKPADATAAATDYSYDTYSYPGTQKKDPRVIEPPEHVAWGLLSIGAVVFLYAFRRGGGGG